MAKKFPIKPANPERICWGCDQYCPADSMRCGNGSDRTQHPYELFGEDWRQWGGDFVPAEDAGRDTDNIQPASGAQAHRRDFGVGAFDAVLPDPAGHE